MIQIVTRKNVRNSYIILTDKIKRFAENGLELSLIVSLENLKGDSTIAMQLSNNNAKWHKSYSDEFNTLQRAKKRKQDEHKDEKNKKKTKKQQGPFTRLL